MIGIGYKKRFHKELKKLRPKIRKHFYSQLEIFKLNKFDQRLNNHTVSRAYPNCRSIDVTGDYRAIFEDFDNVVIFIHIGTHSQLY